MANIAPIRSQEEIDQIILRGQHTIGDLGLELVKEEKRGIDVTNRDHRDKMYRLILLRIYFLRILNEDGEVRAFYTDAANEEIYNRLLDGIVRLSRIFDGAAIPKITGMNLPLIISSLVSGGGTAISGSITRFTNADVDSPSEVVDSFNTADWAEFALWIYKARGSGVGEGSRAGMVLAVGRDAVTPDFWEIETPNIGGTTLPVTFSVEVTAGVVSLKATSSSNNWSISGVRII